MRLSEAIRLGAMLRPQGTKSDSMLWWLDDRRTCALGAALHAQGLREIEGIYAFHLIRMAHPWLDVIKPYCPNCSIQHLAYEIIYHLNDGHQWTRERIADWVETIEPVESRKAAGGIGSIREEVAYHL